MKKILILIASTLLFVCLVFSMVCSASATELEYFDSTYTHKWTPKESVSSLGTIDYTLSLKFKIVYGNVVKTGRHILMRLNPSTSTYEYVNFYSGSVSNTNIITNIEWKYANSNTTLNLTTQNTQNYKVLYTETPTDEVKARLSLMFDLVEVRLPTCDGFACPVSDYNTDGVCDTCGNTLAYSVMRSYTPENYPDNLPPMPVGFGEESNYIVLDPNNDGTIEMYTFTPYSDMPVTTYAPKITQYGSIGVETFDSIGSPVDVKFARYRLGNDSQWYYIDGTSDAVHIFADTTKAKMIYTSMSIYNYDGTLFFPLPLWARVEQVTQGQMETVQPQVGGTMLTLVLCGVGLMACLVVLSLFGKRSLIYLKR